jgi:hypothetical protein
MATEPIRCPRCGNPGRRLAWQAFSDGRRHIKATCNKCGTFVGYAPQTPQNVAEAERAPVPAAPRGLWDGLEDQMSFDNQIR